LTVTEWSRRQSIHANTLRHRLKKGWSVDEALNTPVKH
jgi:sugar diacid utilization regulator